MKGSCHPLTIKCVVTVQKDHALWSYHVLSNTINITDSAHWQLHQLTCRSHNSCLMRIWPDFTQVWSVSVVMLEATGEGNFLHSIGHSDTAHPQMLTIAGSVCMTCRWSLQGPKTFKGFFGCVWKWGINHYKSPNGIWIRKESVELGNPKIQTHPFMALVSIVVFTSGSGWAFFGIQDLSRRWVWEWIVLPAWLWFRSTSLHKKYLQNWRTSSKPTSNW